MDFNFNIILFTARNLRRIRSDGVLGFVCHITSIWSASRKTSEDHKRSAPKQEERKGVNTRKKLRGRSNNTRKIHAFITYVILFNAHIVNKYIPEGTLPIFLTVNVSSKIRYPVYLQI